MQLGPSVNIAGGHLRERWESGNACAIQLAKAEHAKESACWSANASRCGNREPIPQSKKTDTTIRIALMCACITLAPKCEQIPIWNFTAGVAIIRESTALEAYAWKCSTHRWVGTACVPRVPETVVGAKTTPTPLLPPHIIRDSIFDRRDGGQLRTLAHCCLIAAVCNPRSSKNYIGHV